MKNQILGSFMTVAVSLVGSFAQAASSDAAYVGYCTVTQQKPTPKMIINPPREVRLKIKESIELLRIDDMVFTLAADSWIGVNKELALYVLDGKGNVKHGMSVMYGAEIPYQLQLWAGDNYQIVCFRDQ